MKIYISGMEEEIQRRLEVQFEDYIYKKGTGGEEYLKLTEIRLTEYPLSED